jgi:thiol-disulfide isomerase/thioredoxin
MKNHHHTDLSLRKQLRRRIERYLAGILPVMLVFVFQVGTAGASQTLDGTFPGLSSGPLKSAILSDLPEDVIFESGPIVIQRSDLVSKLNQHEPKLRTQLEKSLFFVLEQEAAGMMLTSEAQAAMGDNKEENNQELIQRHLAGIAEKARVTEDEVKAFYDGHQEMVGGASFDQVKEPIRQLLMQQKQEALVNDYIQNLGLNREMKVNRQWAEEQYALALKNPVDQARRSGKPSMIEFGATGCIPCDMMQPVLDSLRKKFGSDLNVVFVHVGEEQILGARYNIRSIPVQVFFDAKGREVFRHEGFFPEEKILPILKKMGLG